ncbi:MAG TPA: DUF488 domain-containing protein [Terriglobales bacterium]|nr:DUF488 domain-containing protein [Terriglobales bacterium]
MPLYTIGHSTRTLDDFIETLRAHEIQTLVDIRSFPMSRRLPHFNRESLEKALARTGISYRWLPALGGRRKKTRDDSPHVALRNDSFRNYADYMLTAEFEQGVEELLKLAERSRTAYLCAERVYFHCHRMLVSDWLVAHGHQVFHIDGKGPAKPHQLMPEARLVEGHVIYRGDTLF